MRERRGELFNKGRPGLLPPKDVQETLIEIVRREFDNLATAEKSEIILSTKTIVNSSPLDQDEALKEESELIAEQGLYFHFTVACHHTA